jgi:hypothetical protein
MTKPEWLDVVAEMIGHWPHAAIPDATVGAWYELVADLEVTEIRAAMRIAAVDPAIKFPPTGGHLRAKVLGELREDRSVWGEVWEEIMDSVSRFGAQREAEIVWSSAIVEQLVKMAGFQELCIGDVDALPTIEAQWRGKWEALRRRALQERVWKGLPTAGLPRLEMAAADTSVLVDAEKLAIEERARRKRLSA